jgi:hypothetical protein
MVGIRAGDIGGEASIDIHADETIGGRRPACMNTNVLPAASETPLADQWKMSELGLVDIQIVLLCHKLCVAAGTSWELSHESVDEFSPDGGDRLGDMAFGADGRRRAAAQHSIGGTLYRS